MQSLPSPPESEFSRAHSLVLTRTPTDQSRLCDSYHIALGQKRYQVFSPLGQCQDNHLCRLCCSVTTRTAVWEHRQPGRRVCRVLKSAWIRPFHPLISGWLRAAQRLNLPQRTQIQKKKKKKELTDTPSACTETEERHRERGRETHVFRKGILEGKCTGWEFISWWKITARKNDQPPNHTVLICNILNCLKSQGIPAGTEDDCCCCLTWIHLPFASC